MLSVYPGGPDLSFPELSGNQMLEHFGATVERHADLSIGVNSEAHQAHMRKSRFADYGMPTSADRMIKEELATIAEERRLLDEWRAQIGGNTFTDAQNQTVVFPLGATVRVHLLSPRDYLAKVNNVGWRPFKPQQHAIYSGEVTTFDFNYLTGGSMRIADLATGRQVELVHLYDERKRQRAVELIILEAPTPAPAPLQPITSRPALKLVK